jgi:hypothetical protein
MKSTPSAPASVSVQATIHDAASSAVATPTNPSSFQPAASAPEAVLSPGWFDGSTPIVKGEEVDVTGIIRAYDPISVYLKFTNLKDTNCAFKILMDSRGKDLAKAQDGKATEVKGILTGHFTSDMTLTPTGYGLSDNKVSAVSVTPELQVVDFK